MEYYCKNRICFYLFEVISLFYDAKLNFMVLIGLPKNEYFCTNQNIHYELSLFNVGIK